MSSAVREWHGVDRATFEREVVPTGAPAVLRGVVASWPVVRAGLTSDTALADYLMAHDGGEPLSTYVGPPEIAGRFFYDKDLRGFNFDRGAAPLGAVLAKLLADRDAASPATIYSGAAAAQDHFPGFAAAHPQPLLEPDVMPRLWLGNASRISTHYDVATNLACVAAGRRRFTLFPPEQVRNLYVGPLEHTISGQPVSMVDPLSPDHDRFPRYATAAAASLIAELAPGDALYMPSLWWHHVEAFGPLNLLVNYWWGEPAEASAFEALIHALLAVRDLPERERTAWRAFFDHFAFEATAPAHLPPHARGVLGPPSPARTAMIRDFLRRRLGRAA